LRYRLHTTTRFEKKFQFFLKELSSGSRAFTVDLLPLCRADSNAPKPCHVELSIKAVMEPILVVKDLHKHYKKVKAVNGISFSIMPGQADYG